MKTYAEKFIGEIVFTELDLDPPFYDDGSDERNEVLTPYHMFRFAKAPSISIDKVRKALDELEAGGANRVYLADHADHKGYYIYGVKLVLVE